MITLFVVGGSSAPVVSFELNDFDAIQWCLARCTVPPALVTYATVYLTNGLAESPEAGHERRAYARFFTSLASFKKMADDATQVEPAELRDKLMTGMERHVPRGVSTFHLEVDVFDELAAERTAEERDRDNALAIIRAAEQNLEEATREAKRLQGDFVAEMAKQLRLQAQSQLGIVAPILCRIADSLQFDAVKLVAKTELPLVEQIQACEFLGLAKTEQSNELLRVGQFRFHPKTGSVYHDATSANQYRDAVEKRRKAEAALGSVKLQLAKFIPVEQTNGKEPEAVGGVDRGTDVATGA